MAKRKEPAEPVTKLTSGDLVQRLRARFSEAGRYSVVEQLGNGTGHGCDSWIDVAVVSLWPSDGLGIDAYEVKVSRSDFTRELLNPGKNSWCRDELSSFSFVVASASIVKDGELPDGVGLFVANGDGLKVIKVPRRTERRSYSPCLMAALARASKKSDKLEDRLQREVAYRADPVYQAALAWRAAGKAFLTKRGQFQYHTETSVASLAAAFDAAGQSAKELEAKTLVQQRLEGFQSRMMDLFGDFAVLAQTTLTETDEVGAFVLDAWGGGKEVAHSRFERRQANDKAKRDHEEREFLAAVAAYHEQQRENPVPEVAQTGPLTEALEALSKDYQRPDRRAKSPRGEMPDYHEARKALGILSTTKATTLVTATVALTETKPLTPDPTEPQPGLCPPTCPRCLIPNDQCPCPPEGLCPS
jgi:hypothetical protein